MEQFLSKFRDPGLARRILERIRGNARSRHVLMEVCGTHTMAISHTGIRDLLAGQLDLRSGPGCPVCVTDAGDIDRMIALAGIPNVILATFGDMMRVPGSKGSLLREKAGGRDVRVVYSPLDAVHLAGANPDKEVIFLGVGFETTVPVVALALEQAVGRGLSNFSVFSAHKLTPPAVEALLRDEDIKIDGLICPGHVSSVIGRRAWEFVGREYGIPAVIAGFEPVDLLAAVDTLLNLLAAGESGVINGYTRAVKENGNEHARSIIDKYFEKVPARWRGLGLIPDSGLRLKRQYQRYDALRRFPVTVGRALPPVGCSCGDILRGKITPPECPLFGSGCTPAGPVGPCMVSSEGACAAYYQYHRREC